MNYIEKHLGCSKHNKAILELEWLLLSNSANLSAVFCTLQYISHRVEKGHSFSTTMLGDPDSDQGKVTDESMH